MDKITAVKREDLPVDYEDMMKTETHHDHKIIEDEQGVLRWEEDPFIRKLVDEVDLNWLMHSFYESGKGKNSEIYREFYRRIGYSLSGYWEIFYWEVNNEEVNEYKQPHG